MFRCLSTGVRRRPGFLGTRGTSSSAQETRKNEEQRRKTIYAVSSGYGKCGVAVVRISGPAASAAIFKMTKTTRLQPRKALLKTIRDADSGEVLDKGLCLWFPGPHSFTGEDSVEFHVHGGPAILSAVLSSLSKLEFRLATAGEFTKRAFFNGKLDLTEAEAIGDLIEAETEQQRRQAARQSSGVLRMLYDTWRTSLLTSLANLEASIDFEEEDNLKTTLPTLRTSLTQLRANITSHLSDRRRGEILRNGARLVIVGEPNAGKSSLLNFLSGRQAAIVTAVPGTTRDAIELPLDVNGYPVVLTDTAGIREKPDDVIEREGIRRTLERARDADLMVAIVDARHVIKGEPMRVGRGDWSAGTDRTERAVVLNRLETLGLERRDEAMVLVANKVDLLTGKFNVPGFIGISCKTGEGIDELLRELGRRCEYICGDASKEQPVITRARYREHLNLCAEHIENFLERTNTGNFDIAISAEEIRAAARELGKITGLISTEEVLDVVFRNFCIGK